MKVLIIIDAGSRTVDYNLTVPNQQVADETLRVLYNAHYSEQNKVIGLHNATGEKCLINTARLVCAVVVE